MDRKELTLEEKVDIILQQSTNNNGSKKQGAINALYSVLGTIIIISLTFAFSFIIEIKSTNQRQDRDIIERQRLDKQKWKSIDYNFQVLNKDKLYLYKIQDNELKTN